MKPLRIGIALLALLAGVVTARAQVYLGGDIEFIFTDHGSRVRLYVEHINNVGDETTDRLRIRLWGTQDRDDAYFEGRVLSNALVPRVERWSEAVTREGCAGPFVCSIRRRAGTTWR